MDNSISTYFNCPPSFEIPGVTFPIDDYYLEDIINIIGYTAPSMKASRHYSDEEKSNFANNLMANGYTNEDSLATVGMLARSEKVPPDLVAAVVEHIVETQDLDTGSILIFTSGIAEIDAIVRAIRGTRCSSELEILPLHASLPPSSQKVIFRHSKRQKVIVATNVAETSITIPDCRYVIDTAKVKEQGFKDGLTCLTEVWTSQASTRQRRGRAGRTRAGTCFKLYTRWTEDRFAAHTDPEILRVPLVCSFKRSYFAHMMIGEPTFGCSSRATRHQTFAISSTVNLAAFRYKPRSRRESLLNTRHD